MATDELQPCPLRGLTLCDGQVLEDPDRALTICVCKTRDVAARLGDEELARECVDWLWRARERFSAI